MIYMIENIFFLYFNNTTSDCLRISDSRARVCETQNSRNFVSSGSKIHNVQTSLLIFRILCLMKLHFLQY